jgi:ankyrin repeat protein
LISGAVTVFVLGGCADKPPVTTARVQTRPVPAEVAVQTKNPTPAPAAAPDGPAARPKARYEDRLTRMLTAAQKGQVSVVLEALAEGANINDKDESGETALMKAAAHGHDGLVTELLARGASTNEKDSKGQTALMRAAEGGNVSILKLLMAGALVARSGEKAVAAGKDLLKGAGVNLPNIKVPGLGDAPLGATELDLQDSQGQTALMKAAAAGQVQTVTVLLRASLDSARLMDHKGQTALTHAILKGSPDCVTAILGAGLYENMIRDNEGNTPLHHAAAQGNVEMCRALLNVMVWTANNNQPRGLGKVVFPPIANNQGQTPLLKAVAKGNSEVVQLLLDSFEKDPRARFEYIQRKDNSGKGALRLAEDGGHQEVAALLKDYNEAFNRDSSGLTGLLSAAEAGDVARVKSLLGRGADVLAHDPNGRTALMLAASKGHKEVAELLLASFGDQNERRLECLRLKDRAGKTAAAAADEANHKDLAALFKDYTDFDTKDDLGMTPLMKAAEKGDRAAVERLIAKGADLAAKDNKGMTPLMHAASKGMASVIPIVGQKTDGLRDGQGRTALMHAAENGHLDAARAIMDIIIARSQPFPQGPAQNYCNLVDKTGKTAKQLAEEKKHSDVLQYLGGF